MAHDITALETHARRGDVVVMAGAGVSAGRPSSLPGWKPLNAMIFQALRQRLEAGIGRTGWLAQVEQSVNAVRSDNRFPPEYQAQLIEEICGERYFRALQSLDVEVTNSAHEAIAALASAGALRAIVTTNFDRLIERALERRGVAPEVVRDDTGFIRLSGRWQRGEPGPLAVIKIHGCVSDHRSMIDTLKQRKRGRAKYLEQCLAPLHTSHWLYLGFSAADLEGDEKYLGLVEGAARSPGARYVAFPGAQDTARPDRPVISAGATRLMGAYGDRGRVVVADIATHVSEVCASIGARVPGQIPADAALGSSLVEARLDAWASSLSLSATGLCLAAILEGAGESDAAARVMDRLVRKELMEERGTADFQLLQLHYGRLGASCGRYFGVPDVAGHASNASVESTQSLMRHDGTEHAVVAEAWLTLVSLWSNDGAAAMARAVGLLTDLQNGTPGGSGVSSDEKAIDAWISAAQVCVFDPHPSLHAMLDACIEEMEARARRCGDVVRAARIAALRLMIIAEDEVDLYAVGAPMDSLFAEAERVGDGFAMGMLHLAFGRWIVARIGRMSPGAADARPFAGRALNELGAAIHWLERQSMDPWVLLARVEQSKAECARGDFEWSANVLRGAAADLRRFPILTSHAFEAQALWLRQQGDERAAECAVRSIEAARASGLTARAELLSANVNRRD